MKIKAMPINYFKTKLKHIPIKIKYFYNFIEYLKLTFMRTCSFIQLYIAYYKNSTFLIKLCNI